MNSAPTLKESFLAKQDPKTGVSSELLRVLAKLEVDRMTDAVQREQAIQQGQPQGQPTVADTAGQKAEQFMQQQLVQQFAQNHPAQSQQQQAQAPGGLQAAAQVQGAAEGGLTKLQTNLPTKYAGGGIVSFNGEEDSYVSIPGLVAGTSYQDAIREAEKAKDSKYLQDMDKVAEFLGVVPKAVLSPIAQALASPVESFKKMVSAPGYGINSPKEKEYTPPTAGPGAASWGTDIGGGKGFNLAGTSIDRLVALALQNPEARDGILAQMRDQLGGDVVNEAIARVQAPKDVVQSGAPSAPPGTLPGGLATAAAAKAGDSFSDMLRERVKGMIGDGTFNTKARDASDLYTDSMYGKEARELQARQRSGLEALKADHEKEVAGRSPIRDIINALAAGTAVATKGDWAQALLGSTLSYEAAQQKRKESDAAWAKRLLDADVDISKLGVEVGMKRAAAGEASQEKADGRVLTGLNAGAQLDSAAAQREATAEQHRISNRLAEDTLADRREGRTESGLQRQELAAANRLKGHLEQLHNNALTLAEQQLKQRKEQALLNPKLVVPDASTYFAQVLKKLKAEDSLLPTLYKDAGYGDISFKDAGAAAPGTRLDFNTLKPI